MDGQRFDELTRSLGLSLSRKRFLAFVAGLVGPAALADDLDVHGVAAKKKGRRRNRGGVGGQGGGGGACGAPCQDASDCAQCPNAQCISQNGPAAQTGPGTEGFIGVCASQCSDVCIGDCSSLGPDCSCQIIENGDTVIEGCFCTEGCRCEGGCLGKKKKVECPDLPDCVCDAFTNECTFCPGTCADNDECREQGRGDCVCFLGIDTASAERVAEVNAEGNGGLCGQCRGQGHACDASSECCGQLVCQGGTCGRKHKPKPKDRCAKHGHSCTQDSGCCAQATCYRGRCGEKDTHCNSDRECARGYSCVGGRLTGSHRRCRRNGRKKPRNRRNRGG